jgi:transposase, IS30 family
MYKHFTLDERFLLAALIKADFELPDIAETMARPPSSISREILRNSRTDGTYEPRHAHVLAKLRRKKSKENCRKIESDLDLLTRIEKRLEPLVSPEVISQDEDVCHETIYAWIYRSRPDLKVMLPQRGKKRRRYGTKRSKKQGWTMNVRNIEERPAGAENRTRIKHFEGDTVRLDGGAILTHTDRKSRFEIAHLVPNETSDVAYEIIKNNTDLKTAKSITYDRGSTFALWRMIEKNIEGKVYFANAHHPWERGTNENSNQRLRRVFPKGTKYSTITKEDIAKAVWTMNHTKRKCLNWRTPYEVFKG